MLNKLRNKQGFTLIELLIVVAIIGILAAIAIPQFSAYQKRGYASSTRSDAKNMLTAIKAALADDAAATLASVSAVGTFTAAAQPTGKISAARVSSGVQLVVAGSEVNDAYTITGTHTKLGVYNIVISGTGTIADSLSAAF